MGSLLLWGCWVCKAHALAYERAITSNPSHTPPQQPSRKKGRGAKPSPAAMGVTITDLAFMHAIAMEGEKDKAAYVKIKGQMTSLQTENNDLRNDLQKERVEILRLRKETERGTLERQVKEWSARANKAEETCNTTSKAAEEVVKRAREGEKKARAEKNSFVKDLQKRMEIGGIQMYCIEKGSEGMFLPKTELHTQLEAWEKEVERAWEEVGNVQTELQRVAGELRQTKRTHKSLEEHAQALELACSLNFTTGKTARIERDKLEKDMEKQKVRHGKMVQIERQKLELQKANADSLQVQASKMTEKEITRRKHVQERVKKLDKFRLRAKRQKEQRKLMFDKDYSKVPHHKWPAWFRDKISQVPPPHSHLSSVCYYICLLLATSAKM